MSSKYILAPGALAILLVIASCGGDDNATECAGNLCPFVGNWQLNAVAVDGTDVPGNYEDYHLNLEEPTTDPALAAFTRQFPDGQDQSGMWTLENNNDVIVLSTDGDEEEYIVESVSGNQLVLVLERDDTKPGPSQIRYNFGK